MSWKAVVAIIGLALYLIVFMGVGVHRLIDNTCSIDQLSLEKRCQKAIDHYKGRQVNF